jgi:hypothetical protein
MITDCRNMWSWTGASDIFPYTNHFGNISSNEGQTSSYYLLLYYLLILLFSKLNSDIPTEWSKILTNSIIWITSWAVGQAVCACSLSTLCHVSLKFGLQSDITRTQIYKRECHNTKHQNLDKEVRNFIYVFCSRGYKRDNDDKTKHSSAVLLNLYCTKHQRKFRTARHRCEGYVLQQSLQQWHYDAKSYYFMEKVGLKESKALKTRNGGNPSLMKTKTFVWVFIWMRLVLLAERCQGYHTMQNAQQCRDGRLGEERSGES